MKAKRCDGGASVAVQGCEPDEAVVGIDEILGCLGISEVLGEVGDLVVEHVVESFQEDEGEDVVLVLGGIDGATNLARCVPQPLFECSEIHWSSVRQRAVALYRRPWQAKVDKVQQHVYHSAYGEGQFVYTAAAA